MTHEPASAEHEHCEHFHDWPPPNILSCEKCGAEYYAGEENETPACSHEGVVIGRAEPSGDPGDGLGASGICCECGEEQNG